MAEVTNANLLKESQANVWNLLKTDVNVLALTKNVLDGVPQGLTSGTGFPYIIVPTPSIDDEKYITFTHKQVEISFKIEVYDKKEAVSRQLGDIVRNALEVAKATPFYDVYSMAQYLGTNGTLTYQTAEDNSIIYCYTLTAKYKVIMW